MAATKEYLQRWRAENRERVRASERAWRAANPKRLKLMRARAMRSIIIEDPVLLQQARDDYVALVLARTRDHLPD